MQTIITAAGMGKRLLELTADKTKCMVQIGGMTIIERTLRILDEKEMNRIIIVTGYKAESLEQHICSLKLKTPVIFVRNDEYENTNNIYSLSMTTDYMSDDDSIIMESDTIFEPAVIDMLISDKSSNLALVAKPEIWMSGAAVLLDEDSNISQFVSPKDFRYGSSQEYYKAVDIYKFSRAFLVSEYIPFLNAYARAFGHNRYYESVLKVIAFQDRPVIKAVKLGEQKWYEVNDVQDVDIAETIFATGEDKFVKYMRRFGGYWRYRGLHDFCYLVNPYFPNERFMDEMRARFETLIREYPSGMGVNSLLAGKYFGLRADSVVVGNGTSELIKSLMEHCKETQGKIGMIYPTFEEYPHRMKNEKEDVIPFPGMGEDFDYQAEALMKFYEDVELAALILVNPDNPSGHFISREDILELADWAQRKGCRLIVDESFVDFADCKEETSLLQQDTLESHPSLIVLKSISKSFGVPGLRLGILATADKDMIAFMKKDVAIWNINSFGEYYMQIIEKYKDDYELAMKRFMEVRKRYMAGLYSVPNLKVYPTQANYVLCRVEAGPTSRQLADIMLNKYNILIKDLSTKTGFDHGNYIRLAVKTDEENEIIVKALTEVLGD